MHKPKNATRCIGAAAALICFVLVAACGAASVVDDATIQLLPAADSMGPRDTILVHARLALSSGEGAGVGRFIELRASTGGFGQSVTPVLGMTTDSLGLVNARYVAPTGDAKVTVTAQSGAASTTVTITVKKAQPSPAGVR